MDMLRRNTDYALRAMANLAKHYRGDLMSTREVSRQEGISYQLTCKLMQRLHKVKLVESSMGPKGGFRLSRPPAKINLLEIIAAIQGPVKLNRCLLGMDRCPRQGDCGIAEKLVELQEYIDSFLGGITLEQMLVNRSTKKKTMTGGRRKK